ncbi:NAD(P)H-binding protein [Streptomyces sp. AV19]|uniref:NmrA family NAD(P)-binding protein n=1 Tax=Streptomyces sp. AV19 TaxID=2793068 RepID=UPI0018FE1982|nr:NAD(P)H-binding protein [Streptomyces sp. AV19]MBH1935951.1 NAD(P)H-binding protein [Streptomyces sp. AV19]MDG4534260.1 NAD(P)H-binding protein [Streptomyces sp. AV19]
MTAEEAPKPTLVLGGTGKTGRRVAELLTARGLPVRIGSRSATPPFSWEDPSTWDAALDGVGAAYITYYPDLGMPGAAEVVGEFARHAVRKGARRLVLLSSRGDEGARVTERALQSSGADWTILRASWFFQNFDEAFFLDPVLSGELLLPTGNAPEPFIDTADIAEVAVATLTDTRHTGRIYELGGPRLLTFHDVAAELSKATGREIRYTPVTDEAFRAHLAEHGLPTEVADLLALITDGRNARLVDGVQQVLGRAPRDFADYAREVAATGVWTV